MKKLEVIAVVLLVSSRLYAADPKASETQKTMKVIAHAVTEYGLANNMQYPADDKDVVAKLVPKSLKEWPMKDAWGHDIKYVNNQDPDGYWIISYGADGKPDAGIYDKDGAPRLEGIKTTKDPNADIIWQIDFPMQYPEI